MNSKQFKNLYTRELDKLEKEVAAYQTDDEMWIVVPGTINSAGNLVQHLIGNLRTYIGHALGDVPYARDRDAEFAKRLFTKETLLVEITVLQGILDSALSKLTDNELQQEYPSEVLVMFPEQSVHIILTHLLIHLGYHLGQINYHRRFAMAMN